MREMGVQDCLLISRCPIFDEKGTENHETTCHNAYIYIKTVSVTSTAEERRIQTSPIRHGSPFRRSFEFRVRLGEGSVPSPPAARSRQASTECLVFLLDQRRARKMITEVHLSSTWWFSRGVQQNIWWVSESTCAHLRLSKIPCRLPQKY